MKILHVNHRDLSHPRAGGLEEVVHKISERWIRQGHEVTLLCSTFPGSKPEETTPEGLRIVRRCDERWFNYVAPFIVRRQLQRTHDVVLEHISKVPCCLPWFVKDIPVAVHVPHLFGTVVFREAPLPVACYVWLLEQPLATAYRKCRFWALSDSTKEDLISRGIEPDRITIIYGGVEFDEFHALADHPRSQSPSIMYLGRLKKYKGIDLLLQMVVRLRLEFPDVKLVVAGKGDYESTLRSMVRKLGIERHVEFAGFVDHETKKTLLAKSWVLAYPSPKEGWGLSVIEAGACGTPTIASNSPGLRESVRDGETGFLVPHGDIEAMATKFGLLLRDATLRQQFGQSAIEWARRFSWESTAQETLAFLENARRNHQK